MATSEATTLPIVGYQDQIVETVRRHPVTVLIGTTGCGKTTHVPPMLYQAGFAAQGTIGCTLPTRYGAIMAARYVARRAHEEVGSSVGYHVRFESEHSDDTKILYLTDGVLLRLLSGDRDLKQFSVIMLDEAHIRSKQTDYLLAHCKQLIKRRPDVRLVVSSATMHADLFTGYFSNAPLVSIDTRQHDVKVTYRESAADSLDNAVVRAISDLHAQGMHGDVLVFLPGVYEIERCGQAIERLELPGISWLPMHSRLPAHEQKRVFEEAGGHRIILATNIAETAVTIPRVRHVIDSGLIREEGHNVSTNVTTLLTREISKASATQRTGRAGRTAPGTCIRLYDESAFENRRAYPAAEIEHTDLVDVLLQMINDGVDPQTIDLITPLSKRRMQHAVERLRGWGALDESCLLTPLGKHMARLPLDAQLARMVVLSRESSMTLEVAEIAAFLSSQDITRREGGVDITPHGKNQKFRDSRGDALSFMRIAQEYRQRLGNSGWCHANGIAPEFMERIGDVRWQIMQRLGAGIVQNPIVHTLDAIHAMLLRSYGGRVCVADGDGKYRCGDLQGIEIDRYSSLFGKRAGAILAFDLLQTDYRLIARFPLAIPPTMAEEIGQLYGVDDLARQVTSKTTRQQRTRRAADQTLPAVAALEERIGHVFKDKGLLITAMTHRSYLNEHRDEQATHNERLEFLGDAELEVVVTRHLIATVEGAEGELTNLRSRMVEGVRLSAIAEELGIHEFLRMSRGEKNDFDQGGRSRGFLLANALEAIIGALSIDGGAPAAEAFIAKFFLPYLEMIRHKDTRDPKSLFQEVAQAHGYDTPVYTVLDEKGPPHNKTFRVAVSVKDARAGIGVGPSKLQAQVEAARQALKALFDLEPEV